MWMISITGKESDFQHDNIYWQHVMGMCDILSEFFMNYIILTTL